MPPIVWTATWHSVGNPLASEEWQVSQGVQALMRGGLLGRGIGSGLAQQTGFLPVSWSDNIYGVIGEEIGLLGTLFVVLLFALLAYRGLRIALRAPDNFGMLLATGITTMLILAGPAQHGSDRGGGAADGRDVALYQLWRQFAGGLFVRHRRAVEHQPLWRGERRQGVGSGKVCL